MNCPIWICQPNPDPTTTMSPSTSTEPNPYPPQPEPSTSFSISIFFNILFGLVLLAVLASLGFRRYKRTRQNYDSLEMRNVGESDPAQSRENEPLLAARENEPLLAARENAVNSIIDNPAALIEISLNDNESTAAAAPNEARSFFSRLQNFFKR